MATPVNIPKTPRRPFLSRGLAAALCLFLPASPFGVTTALAQSETAETPMTRRVPAQIDQNLIRLDSGADEEVSRELWSAFEGERWVRNVNQPTLLPVLPEPDVANGAGILLIPGGGFQFVSIDNEGYRIAEPLVALGYTVFVLKYRTMPTPESESEFSDHMRQVFAGEPPYGEIDRSVGEALAVADAIDAWQLIQDQAQAFDINPGRVGVLGFSAGAVTALGLARDVQDIPPAFLGYIYGPMGTGVLPASPPPLFAALAADDPLYAGQGFALIEDWQSTGAPVQFHYYENGGHGFASYRRGTHADDWLAHFTAWLGHRDLADQSEQD